MVGTKLKAGRARPLTLPSPLSPSPLLPFSASLSLPLSKTLLLSTLLPSCQSAPACVAWRTFEKRCGLGVRVSYLCDSGTLL